MSETTTPGMSRRQLLEAAGTVAAAVAAAGIASPAAAQESQTQTNDLVALQVAVKGPMPDIVTVPLEPILLSGRPSLKGESPVLGQVAFIDDHEGRVGLGGNPVFGKGKGVLTLGNGDAIHVEWVHVFGPPTAAGAFIVTGGKGAFSGASGNGSFRIGNDPATSELIFTFDGMVATPKK